MTDEPNGKAKGKPASFERSKHVPGECQCPRCIGFQPGNTFGFQPGNTLSVKHGAYVSPIRFKKEIEEVARILINYVPTYREADSSIVQQLALALVQTARLQQKLEDAEGNLELYYKFSNLLLRWSTGASKRLDAVGMTPTSRARLGVDVAAVVRAGTLNDLHADAAREEAIDGQAAEVTQEATAA